MLLLVIPTAMPQGLSLGHVDMFAPCLQLQLLNRRRDGASDKLSAL